MIILAGLGNQGIKYTRTRHNIGHMAIEKIALCWRFPSLKEKFYGRWSEGRIGNVRTGILQTGTYMNESGVSLAAAASFYKVPAENIIVFHDELDLKPGHIKIKRGGGNAGHNGLRSVDLHLSSREYWRVRMGIGHPRDKIPEKAPMPDLKRKVSTYVLQDFSREEQEWLVPLLEGIARKTDLLAEKKFTDFAAQINTLSSDQMLKRAE